MSVREESNGESAKRRRDDKTEPRGQGRRSFLAEAAAMTLAGTVGWEAMTAAAQAAGRQAGKQEKDKKSFQVTVHLVAFTPKEKVSVPATLEQQVALLDSLKPNFMKFPNKEAKWWIYREGLLARLNPIENLHPEVKPFLADLSSTDPHKVEQTLLQMDSRHAFRVVVSLTISAPLDRLVADHRASKPVLTDPDDPKRREIHQLFYACLLRGVSADGFVAIEDCATMTSINLDSGMYYDTGIPGPHEIKIQYPAIYGVGNLSIRRSLAAEGFKSEILPGYILLKTVREVE